MATPDPQAEYRIISEGGAIGRPWDTSLTITQRIRIWVRGGWGEPGGKAHDQPRPCPACVSFLDHHICDDVIDLVEAHHDLDARLRERVTVLGAAVELRCVEEERWRSMFFELKNEALSSWSGRRIFRAAAPRLEKLAALRHQPAVTPRG
jgi:hypothetical protein